MKIPNLIMATVAGLGLYSLYRLLNTPPVTK